MYTVTKMPPFNFVLIQDAEFGLIFVVAIKQKKNKGHKFYTVTEIMKKILNIGWSTLIYYKLCDVDDKRNIAENDLLNLNSENQFAKINL